MWLNKLGLYTEGQYHKAKLEGHVSDAVSLKYLDQIIHAEELIKTLEDHIFNKQPQRRDSKGRFVAKPKPADALFKYREKYTHKIDIEI